MILARPATGSDAALDLVLIDARVPEPELLLAALAHPCRLVRVPLGADGLAVLRRALSETGTPPRSVHLISHGGPGRLLLGREHIDTAALRQREAELTVLRWGLAGHRSRCTAVRSAQERAVRRSSESWPRHSAAGSSPQAPQPGMRLWAATGTSTWLSAPPERCFPI